MSAEATLAVMEHATGTDAEWRMLALLANEADRDGIVANVSMDELAERMGKTVKGVGGVKKGLKKSGQLVVLDEGGGRGRRATYWINLPGLAGPETLPGDSGNGQGETPPTDSGKADSPPPAPPSPSTTSSSAAEPPTTKAAKEREFVELLAPLRPAPEAEVLEDARQLLATGKKVDGKLVTPVEMAIAAAAIAAFNRCFEWRGRQGSDYGLGANLKSIVMRARERPSWDPAKHVRLVESAWRIRWWESNGSSNRRPTPNVIYGGNAFENVVQDARDEAGGEKPAQIKKRRYTRG